MSVSMKHVARAATHPCRLRLIADAHDAAIHDASTPGPSSRPAPKLWFAILTYNALAYTKRCLLSLDLHTTEPWHAVILDNMSSDDTREWLADIDDPRITVQLGDSNRGVAGGRNDLLDLLRDRVPDDGFVVFVDNDLEFYPGWLTPFRRLFDSTPQAGIASCAGYEIVVQGNRRELLSNPGHCVMPVDVAAGGFACFVRPATFRDIGRYDEQLNPFWHEDDDISVRARVAGWEVYCVPNPAVVHHGHKSGAALPTLVQGGSLQKQHYLADKWRAFGIVQPDGRLQYAKPDADHALALRLAARMGRAGAMRRSEYERATLDIALLAQSVVVSGSLDTNGRYASAPARAVLAECIDGTIPDPSGMRRDVAGRVGALLEARRRSTRLAVSTGATPGSTKLADSGDWEAADWFAMAADMAGDGRGGQQWYDRSLTTWRAAQSAHALRRAGALHDTAQVLMVSDVRSPLVWGLASAVASVVVADIVTPDAAGNPPVWLTEPERFATRDIPTGRVRAVSMEALFDGVTPASMHAAVLLPWTTSMAPAELGPFLRAVATRVVPGGVITACMPVRLAGPPGAGMLDAPASATKWLAGLGLALIEPPDLSMSDDGLLSATDAGAMGRTPDLLTIDGARLVGNLFIACTHAAPVGGSA